MQQASREGFDRLDLMSVLLALYFYVYWGTGAAFQSSLPGAVAVLLHGAGMGLAILGVVSRARFQLTALNAMLFVGFYLWRLPVPSNNQTMALALCLILIGALALRLGREQTFAAIARPGRWVLAGLYFFGIFHKLNDDWANPEVSCGVLLYRLLAEPFGLGDWTFGHQGAIWGTLIIEAAAMVGLFLPRWKRLAIALGVPFHLAIGLTGYAFYMDFSTIVLVSYTLFLSHDTVTRMVRPMPRGRVLAAGIGLALVAYAWVAGPLNFMALEVFTDSNFRPLFLVYGVGFFLLILVHQRGVALHWPPLPRAALVIWIVPVFFFLNGWAPYMGARTEGTLSMFSNLHTEGGQSNHWFFARPWPLFTYQEDLVEVGDRMLVRWAYDRRRARQPGFAPDDERPNTYLAGNGLERAYLVFKPVDFDRPKVCTH